MASVNVLLQICYILRDTPDTVFEPVPLTSHLLSALIHSATHPREFRAVSGGIVVACVRVVVRIEEPAELSAEVNERSQMCALGPQTAA